MTDAGTGAPKRTPLYDLHVALGARMVPFAGWAMPVQYKAGIIAEHNHTRTRASLFDVSHMGQVAIAGQGAAAALERLVPGDIQGLAVGRVRYTLLTNEAGGIVDDLMVAKTEGGLHLVVNAARRAVDLAHLTDNLPDEMVAELPDRALLALQGPGAAAVIARVAPGAETLTFLATAEFDIVGTRCAVARSGYTGEDGFEISVPASQAEVLARRLLDEKEVAPAGLGARDTLRLEAGLCLYGSDIDEETTPVEAALGWTIPRRRRAEANFPGADIILAELSAGPGRKRVGLRLDGRVPARHGAEILDAAGAHIGHVTSGSFGPTAGAPIAMGYVDPEHAAAGTAVGVKVRDAALPGRICALPFVPHRYVKST